MDERQPCPDRILDDVGMGFAMGSVGSSAFYFFKGLKNSPRGERFLGGTQAVRMNAPRLAGSFAVWGGLFSAFDCSMVYLRHKEDPWNSILAGAATSAFLSMRGGLRVAARSALVGGVLLSLIEGTVIVISKLDSQQPPIFVEDLPGGAQASTHAETSSSSTWFGDLFKKEEKKKKKKKSADGVETVKLESFDTPIPPFIVEDLPGGAQATVSTPAATSGSSTWFRDLFKKDMKKKSGDGVKTVKL